jgi:hypothetical protein
MSHMVSHVISKRAKGHVIGHMCSHGHVTGQSHLITCVLMVTCASDEQVHHMWWYLKKGSSKTEFALSKPVPSLHNFDLTIETSDVDAPVQSHTPDNLQSPESRYVPKDDPDEENPQTTSPHRLGSLPPYPHLTPHQPWPPQPPKPSPPFNHLQRNHKRNQHPLR